jgi:hypothetical protein
MFGAWKLAAAAAVVLLSMGAGVITVLWHSAVDVPQISGPSFALSVRSAPDVHPVRVPRRSATMVAREPVSAYETVVPNDQLNALDRLLAAMRQGQATVPPVVADTELNDCGERVLRALVVEPLTIEPLAGTPPEPSKNPVKDPNK